MYERYFTYHRDPDLRASDADRDATADRLRKHHAEGRIDPEEFQERLDRCYQAKTVGELDELVNDLPRERDPRSARGLYRRLWPIPLVPLLAAILVISVATWHHGGFGLLWLIPVFFLIRMCVWRRFRRWETF
jgi:Flp pilus assembly protein TadB